MAGSLERSGRSRRLGSAMLRTFALTLLLAVACKLPANLEAAQQQPPSTPDATLSDALSAACRHNISVFADFLTADNAATFKALPETQQTAILKRFVLLEEPGRALFSTGSNGRRVVRCTSPGFTTEMRLGETRVRENLAFVPMEIPVTGDTPRTITVGLVREGGNWKLLSMGLLLLDIPAMAKEWEDADLQASEEATIADLRKVASALDTYRSAYGKLPDSLAQLGPAPTDGASPDAAGLLDANLAGGTSGGYSIRYTVKPASGNPPEGEADKAETYFLLSSPTEYGKTGRRSFYLDSSGDLRGADKQGGLASATDPRIGPS